MARIIVIDHEKGRIAAERIAELIKAGASDAEFDAAYIELCDRDDPEDIIHDCWERGESVEDAARAAGASIDAKYAGWLYASFDAGDRLRGETA